MPTPAVAQLLYMLDEAFDGNEEHSLLGNLRNVRTEDWLTVPPSGSRSIRDIVAHAGVAKHLYADHLFGGATLTYRDALIASPAIGKRKEIDDTIRGCAPVTNCCETACNR